jgi:FSR family fosmidomycin resistance protein-like MFS transporter
MPSYLLVLCLLFVAALGTATFHPWATPLAGGLSKQHKGASLSLFIAAGSLEFALGPLLATGFISLAGFGRTYLLALPPLVGAALLARRARLPEGPPKAEGTAHPELLRSIIPILPLWLIVILRTTVQMAFSTFLLVLLEERALSHLAGSFVLGAFLIMGTAGTLLGGYLSDRFGRRLITTLSLALSYPLYLGFLSTEGLPSFLLLAAAGTVVPASNPVLVAQAQELAPGHAGMASALTMGFGWGIAGLLMGLVGWMGDLWGLTASLRWTTLALPLAAAISLRTREARPGAPS